MCGVFGVCAPDRDVARLAYFGLYALQHRGQESAGIAVSERGRLTALRDLGLVTQVFDEQSLSGLQGTLAIGHELRTAIEGIARAAEELGIPVVSGNVSLYNETGGRPIPPTPVVGCVGLVRDVTRVPARWQRGDRVYLLRGESAALVTHVWQNAHRFSLATDGPLEEAARWSGIAVDFNAPNEPGVIVAGDTAGWPDAVELGVV